MVFLGEIRMFAGTAPPTDWAFCHGQELLIASYPELYGLLGSTYGGDGITTFALPDLRGRLPVACGQNEGVTYLPGDKGGVEQVALTNTHLPPHTHSLRASTDIGDQTGPQGRVLSTSFNVVPYVNDPGAGAMAPAAVSSWGGGQPHTNMQPYLCLNFIIALTGYAL